mmetsp:Transcript_2770/g.8144  ORF Transcript_2770/g.8144 Transcript_2770/m.8144 type:complete len:291 (+) Transcript_2770:1013-1885(+)
MPAAAVAWVWVSTSASVLVVHQETRAITRRGSLPSIAFSTRPSSSSWSCHSRWRRSLRTTSRMGCTAVRRRSTCWVWTREKTTYTAVVPPPCPLLLRPHRCCLLLLLGVRDQVCRRAVPPSSLPVGMEADTGACSRNHWRMRPTRWWNSWIPPPPTAAVPLRHPGIFTAAVAVMVVVTTATDRGPRRGITIAEEDIVDTTAAAAAAANVAGIRIPRTETTPSPGGTTCRPWWTSTTMIIRPLTARLALTILIVAVGGLLPGKRGGDVFITRRRRPGLAPMPTPGIPEMLW